MPESACGDQWLFIFNRETGVGYFWGSDLDWKRFEIRDDKIQDFDLVLGADEFAWLRLSWSTASGRELESPPVHEIQAWLAEKEKQKAKPTLKPKKKATKRKRKRTVKSKKPVTAKP